MPEPVRLLCAGDIHLGRQPARLPPRHSELVVARVWERFVQTAIDRKVDAVVLTGDIVDEENKVFEAMRVLERGVRRLGREGVEVVAVSGNHDYDALPRLVRNLGDAPFHLIGEGGQWDAFTLEREGRPLVRFVGWSFPSQHVHASPLETFELEPADDLPTIGVLHGDVDQPGSAYAPVERRALRRAPVDGWLMGHIHRSDAHYEEQQLQLYTGSLQPLHPNEPGVHGAWMTEVGAGGLLNAEHLPLASLRYDEVRLDVTGLDTIDEIEQAASGAVRAALKEAAHAMPHLQQAVYRIAFTGRTALRREIRERARAYVGAFEPSHGDATAIFDDYVLDELRTDHDLERHAASSDAPGAVAQLLLDLQNDGAGEGSREALRRAKQALQSVHRATGYGPLRDEPEFAEPPADEAVRSMLQQSGLLLLDELLDSQEPADHA